MTTPDPITTAREALAYIAENFSEDVPDEVYSKADADYDAITAALDYAEKLNAENERLTNKVQSQHDHMAPKYDAAMAEVEKLKAERDELEKEIDRLNRCFRIVPPANDFLPWKKVPWTMTEEMQKHFKLSLFMGGTFLDAWTSALSVSPVSEAPQSKPEGLEWRRGGGGKNVNVCLSFNGRKIGEAWNGRHGGGWVALLMGGDLGGFDTEAEASAKLEAAARTWLSPVSEAADTVMVRRADAEWLIDHLYKCWEDSGNYVMQETFWQVRDRLRTSLNGEA